MLKLAFTAGVVLEWLLGPEVHSAIALAYASLRTFLMMMAAWMVLEAIRVLVQAVDQLESD